MLDVLMGRIKVFAQFDHEEFFRLAARSGIKMRFVLGKRAARIRQPFSGGSRVDFDLGRGIHTVSSGLSVLQERVVMISLQLLPVRWLRCFPGATSSSHELVCPVRDSERDQPD
jgi:hypothetical protein